MIIATPCATASAASRAAPQHTPTLQERRLYARLPLPVAAVLDPADRRALGALVDARLALLALGGAGEIVVARRPRG